MRIWTISTIGKCVLLALFYLSLSSCIDVSIDPLDPLGHPPHDGMYISLYADAHYTHPQCYADIVFEYDHPIDCDDECCYWEDGYCELLYCTDDVLDCDWKLVSDSCVT